MASEKRNPLNIFGQALDKATQETKNVQMVSRSKLVGAALQAGFVTTYGKIVDRKAWLNRLNSTHTTADAVKNPLSILAVINPLNVPLALMRSVRNTTNLLLDRTNLPASAKTGLKIAVGAIPFMIEAVLTPFTEFPRLIPATIQNRREYAALSARAKTATDPDEVREIQLQIRQCVQRDPSIEKTVPKQPVHSTRGSTRNILDAVMANPAKNSPPEEVEKVDKLQSKSTESQRQSRRSSVEVIGIGENREILKSEKKQAPKEKEEEVSSPRPRF